ncbi:hypothetical protein [Streptomyces sp. NPDC003401]
MAAPPPARPLFFDSRGAKILSFQKLANRMKAARADGILVTS